MAQVMWQTFSPLAIMTVYIMLYRPGVPQAEGEYATNIVQLHPYNMVTASCNNNQLESGFMNKCSIPRRPYFPRFGLFSWAHCWPWKAVI